MEKVRKYFVKFFSPGLLFGESNIVELPKEIPPEEIDFPDNTYSFSLFWRDDIIIDGSTFRGESSTSKPMYYHPDSKIETLEEVKKNHPSDTILVSNMEHNKWNTVIWSRWNNWPQPYKPGRDVLLPKQKRD